MADRQLDLDPIPPVGYDGLLFREVANRISQAIKDQGLTTGDLVPGEGPIARALKVSRPIVADGLNALEADGLIVRRYGCRTRVV